MFPQLGVMEMMVVMSVAVLLFGKRLPEVGRSLGKGIIEFKKGLRGFEDGFDSGPDSTPDTFRSRAASPPAASADPVPKFEPPAVPQMEYQPQATPRD